MAGLCNIVYSHFTFKMFLYVQWLSITSVSDMNRNSFYFIYFLFALIDICFLFLANVRINIYLKS